MIPTNIGASQAALIVKNLFPDAGHGKDRGLVPGLRGSSEEDKATHSSILAWRIPMDIEAWWATVHRIAKNWTQLSDLVTHTPAQRKNSKSTPSIPHFMVNEPTTTQRNALQYKQGLSVW